MSQNIKDLSFEEAMSELDNIVNQLENGRIKLEDAVKAYERGVQLKNLCMEKLQAAKSKIDLLVPEGNTITGKEDFDAELKQ